MELAVRLVWQRFETRQRQGCLQEPVPIILLLHLGVIAKPLMAHPQPQGRILLWSGIATKFDAAEQEWFSYRRSSLLQITGFAGWRNSDLQPLRKNVACD
jgi:hypothetical protein